MALDVPLTLHTDCVWVEFNTLWSERNRQRRAPDSMAASDLGRNFETGTSWAAIALDMCFISRVPVPAVERNEMEGSGAKGEQVRERERESE